MKIKHSEKEKSLINEFIAGNERAFNELVSIYQKCIYWHARRMMGNHLDADEITQQVIIIMYKKLSSFNFNSSLKTWIYRITSNRCLNLIKMKKMRSFLSLHEGFNENLISEEDIIEDIEVKEKVNVIKDLLNKLPLRQKQIFVLRHFDNLTYKEISAITGKSIGGLKANYFHAATKIFEMIKNEKL